MARWVFYTVNWSPGPLISGKMIPKECVSEAEAIASAREMLHLTATDGVAAANITLEEGFCLGPRLMWEDRTKPMRDFLRPTLLQRLSLTGEEPVWRSVSYITTVEERALAALLPLGLVSTTTAPVDIGPGRIQTITYLCVRRS